MVSMTSHLGISGKTPRTLATPTPGPTFLRWAMTSFLFSRPESFKGRPRTAASSAPSSVRPAHSPSVLGERSRSRAASFFLSPWITAKALYSTAFALTFRSSSRLGICHLDPRRSPPARALALRASATISRCFISSARLASSFGGSGFRISSSLLLVFFSAHSELRHGDRYLLPDLRRLSLELQFLQLRLEPPSFLLRLALLLRLPSRLSGLEALDRFLDDASAELVKRRLADPELRARLGDRLRPGDGL